MEKKDPTDPSLPDRAIHGRGAVSNRPGRFEPGERPQEDDGWYREEEESNERGPATSVIIDSSKSILSSNDSPDIPFNHSINPYRGCEHGCIYCYARPSHAYLGHSPGLDFETKIYAKPEAAKLLEIEFRKPRYRPSAIALGSNTDPYQPIERKLRIMRSLLQVFSDFNHPLSITTKGARILEDIEILASLASRNLIVVLISVTSLDSNLSRTMEPRASSPSNRLRAIHDLSEAGIPVAVSIAPIIPALNDHEIESIIEATAKAGARFATYVTLRLPLEIESLFSEWLQEHKPERAKHILSLVKNLHGGKIYRSEFGTRMKGSGAYADLIRARVAKAAKRYGLNESPWPRLDYTRFKIPASSDPQMRLFD